jgi:HEAT repeat protein
MGVGPAAVPALIAVLGDASENVRLSAAIALGRIGLAASEAVPALIAALGDG